MRVAPGSDGKRRSDPLRIPEEVQDFVDAAHFEIGRIETYLEDAEGRSASPVFDLMGKDLERVKAARQTGMQGVGRPGEEGGRVLLSETGWKRGAQHGDLGALATPDSRDTSEVSAGTRFEEVPSVHASPRTRRCSCSKLDPRTSPLGSASTGVESAWLKVCRESIAGLAR